MSIVSFNSSDQQIAQRTQISMKRIRLDVLRALAFQNGHKMAETKLQIYVNRFDDKEDESMKARHQVTQNSLETVLSESRGQVSFADEMLEEVSDKDLEIILSQYCAKILVRRLYKFIAIKSQEGLIGRQETRKYMRSMKDTIREIESSTVERLAESRLSEDREHQQQHTQSDLQNILEDSKNTVAIDGNSNKKPSSPITNSTISQVDPQNADTVGASNVKSKEPTIPLSKLFETPSGLSETSMPEIEEDGHENNDQ